MKRALVNAAVEALWERLIVERSVLTAGELGQLRTARAAAHSQGGHLTLEQQLLGVLGARLEPLREELRARARSCGRCQSCFLAAPPHGTCPTCGQAGSSFQATSTSGILAPQRPASEATVLLPPRAPQGPGYSSSSGSGA